MADNVAITAGSGTSIATDDAGAGGHVQIVKLAIATDGSATLIPADGTDGMLVNLGSNNDVVVTNAGTFAVQVSSALPSGTNGIGKLTANSGVTIGAVELAAAQTLATVSTVTAVTGGGVASGASDSGNPHKVGGKYNSTPITLTDGQRGDLQLDAKGSAKVIVMDATGAAVATAVDRLTDNIGVALQTDALLNDTTALTPKFKRVSIAASQTDSSVVAAVTSKKIRVVAMRVMVGGTATDLTLESDGGSDTVIHEGTYGANGGEVLPFNPVGWFETLSGEALIATTGSGSTTKITLVYVEV